METLTKTQKIDLLEPGYTERLARAPIYVKRSTIRASQAAERIPITTVLADGTVETRRYAEPGDWIITNPGGEQYVIRDDAFAKQYAPTDQPGEFRSIDAARIMDNPTGMPIEIMAPWGEPQFGEPDCKIAASYDYLHPEQVSSDRYLIGAEEFAATYVPAPETERN